MDFSVIITTLDRWESVIRLINRIFKISNNYSVEIVVVYAGEIIESEKLLYNEYLVKFIKSNHKNQPFQRYLGTNHVTNSITLFFDDDLIIEKDTLFDDLVSAYSIKDVVGVGFGYVNSGELYKKINCYRNSCERFLSDIRYLEFNRKDGDIGIGGRQALNLTQKSDFVNALTGGNVPTCKTEFIKHLWDDRIFQLAEIGMGKGEDKYFTLGMNKFGRIYYLNDHYITHPINESTYKYSYFRWRAEILRTRFLICDRYCEVYSKNKLANRVKILMGSLIEKTVNFKLNKKYFKQLIMHPFIVCYAIYYTWIKNYNVNFDKKINE